MSRFSLLRAGLAWRTIVAVFFGVVAALAVADDDSYLINKGDKLRVDVWQEENLRMEVLVSPDGTISFPLIGIVPAAGKTLAGLREDIRNRLDEYIPSPEVNVTLLTLEGNVIYILGEVARPGPYIMLKDLQVIQALSLAGGLTPFASKDEIHIVRKTKDGRFQSIPFDYGEVEDGEDLETNIPLQSGDTVIVP